MKRIAILILAVVLVAGAQSKDEAERLLKAAKNLELVDGDLNGAIKQYRAIVAKYAKTDRAVTAMSLVQMAECYQKSGDAEAQKIYRQVVREYGDQKEAVALARVHLETPHQPGRQTNSLVWTNQRLNASPTVSYDGRYISFIDLDTGDVALHEIATSLNRHLTNNPKNSGERGYGAVVSHDGKLTVYNWWNNKDKVYEIRLVNITGDPNPRRVYANRDVDWMNLYDWSPDDKSVAVQLQRQDQTRQIGLLSVPDGTLRVLKPVDGRGTGRIFFSPDGKYLGYDLPQSDMGSERDVFVLPVDGSREIHAVSHPGNDVMMGWSPNGKWLLFASDRLGSTGIWGLPFTGGKSQGAPVLLKTDIAARAFSLGLTSSEALYYLAPRPWRSRILLATFDFAAGKYLSGPTEITKDNVEDTDSPADWSPDGRQLAYVSLRDPNPVLVIHSTDTAQVRELRPQLRSFSNPAWAPDGHSFLIQGTDLQGRRGIYQIDADTAGVSTLLQDKPGEFSSYPAWAKDGKSFYFPRRYAATKHGAFIRRDLATGQETELIRRRFLAQVNMSPDCRYIATRSIDESTNLRTLILIPLDGGEVRELMQYPSEIPEEYLWQGHKGVWFGVKGWAPDSRSIVAWKEEIRFTADQKWRGKERETWLIPIDGGTPRKLDEPKPSFGDLSVSADGRIAFTITESTPRQDPEVWALENFLPKDASK